jgi:hypothetical protein
MTATEIRTAIDRVGVYAVDLAGDRAEADRVTAAVRGFARPALFELLAAAGLEAIRPRDSKAALVRRLHNRLTARVRARERAEV